VESIIKCRDKVFGISSKIYLFGSRVDDTLRGGDIDLYIQTEITEDSFKKRIEFLVELEKEIGEQKVDLVFNYEKSGKSIEMEVLERGIELDLERLKLKKYFYECDRHLQRIEEACEDIEKIIPITTKKSLELTKEEVKSVDQYLFRFAKLQDCMGDKIFKIIISLYEINSSSLPFLDVLNKLEKIGFLNSAKEWINLRKIRNEISHQYDDNPQEISLSINNILYQKNIIKNIYITFKKKYEVLIDK
jgi:predicted nucleotidyltransferase